MTAGHHRRSAAAALIGLTLLLALAAGPASAIGAQGVDLQPLLDRQDGLLTATVDVETVIEMDLVNTGDQSQTVNLTAVSATRGEDGGYQLGVPLEWVELDASSTTIQPNQTLQRHAALDLAGYRDTQPELIALVMAVEGGGNVTARAATIVQLRDAGASLPISISLLLIAGSLVVLAALMWWRVARDEKSGLGPLRRRTTVAA